MNKYAVLAPDRKTLVRRIAAMTGLVAVYTRMPRCAYVIGPFAIEKDGVMNVEDGADMNVIRTLLQEGLIDGDYPEEEGEPTIQAEPEEPTAQAQEDEIEDEATAEPEEIQCADESHVIQPTISFPLAQHTPESIRNLVFMLYSKGWLMSKATGGRFAASPDLMQELKETLNPTVDTIRAAVQVEDAIEGLVIEEDRITFTGFPSTDDPETIKAWTQFAAAINKAAIMQKRVQTQVIEAENEKFALHVWMARLGMGGKEQKKARSILYRNLTGHSAFRTPADEEQWKAKEKAKREKTV